jgi:membrane associated rhomboid family serine protease
MSKFKDSGLYQSIKFPASLLVLLWIIQLFQYLTGFNLGGFGIYPRHLIGFKGVFTSPFIHASNDMMHLINNSVPLFVSMAVILFFYRRVAYQSIAMIYVLTGLAVWIFARPVFHIGASGVIYGLVSFIFWNGIFRRNIKSIVLALIILLLYSGMFLGVLPNQPGISWESHLIGGLVGIVVSFFFRHQLEWEEIAEKETVMIEEGEEGFFLERDTFEKTFDQRKRDRHQDWNSNTTW